MEKQEFTLEQIKNFTNDDWLNFRRNKWLQKQQAYNNPNIIPDWFWPAKKEKDEKDLRRKTWLKRCRSYSIATSEPAKWFLPSKENYIDFLVTKRLKFFK